jgi:signal transduction histidine kinase
MKRRKSIKTKLIQLFLIMGIFPSLLVMTILFFGVSSNLEKQTGNNLKTLAMETSLRVDMFIQNKIDNVLKYASYSTLKRIYFPGGSEETTSEFIRSLFKFDGDLYNISLVTNRKKTLFSYRPNFFSMHVLDAWWEQASRLDEGEVLLSPLERQQERHPMLDVVTPLVSDLNRKRLGFMVTTFDLTALVDMIENIQVSGEYYIALVDERGKLLSDTRIDRENGGVSKNMMQLFRSGPKGGWAIGFDDTENARSVFGFSPVSIFLENAPEPRALWVYVSRSKEEAFRPILSLMIKLLALCLGVVFLILIIFVFRIETIWKPILSLKKGAEMIGAGNFDMVLFVPTNDELEDLAQSFNKMGKNLKNSRRTLEEQNRKLVELNNVKNNFLSMVSHELRTPLMIIKEALSQVLGGLKGPVPAEQKEFLNMAFRNAGRLNQIIQDLLNISKIETGKLKFTRQKADMAALLRNEIKNQRIKCDERGIAIRANFDKEYLETYCDAEKIRIVFTNLLGNAIKFTRQGGTIEVTLEATPDGVRVAVKDEGPGIPSDSLERIFERFVRLNASPLVGAPSTGLGLAIARELVEMHEGEIHAESDGRNGSLFYFTLPRYRGEDYLRVYWNDRIQEAADRELDLSVFNLQVLAGPGGAPMDRDAVKHVLDDLKKLGLRDFFEPLETISLEQTAEIYVFSFCGEKSAGIICRKIRGLISREGMRAVVASATLHVHGEDQRALMESLETEKARRREDAADDAGAPPSKTDSERRSGRDRRRRPRN